LIKFLSEQPKELVRGGRVFCRVDFDVPFNPGGSIASDFRIKRCLPTIKYLLNLNCSVVLATKLGKPREKKISSEKILNFLICQLAQSNLSFVKDYPNENARKAIGSLKRGRALLLENVRLFPEENTERGEDFAYKFAKNFDFYVNEAFSICHRKETSVTELPKYLPSYAGLNLEKEVKVLSKVSKNPQRPLVMIIGGKKSESKLPVIENFINKADKIFIAGALAQESEALYFSRYENVTVLKLAKSGLDISSKSTRDILNYLKSLTFGTVVWVGPISKFEVLEYEKGTKEVALAIANSRVFKVAGGGDTISALEKFGVLEKFNFVSTGGGSVLKFLAGEKLPGLEVLAHPHSFGVSKN